MGTRYARARTEVAPSAAATRAAQLHMVTKDEERQLDEDDRDKSSTREHDCEKGQGSTHDNGISMRCCADSRPSKSVRSVGSGVGGPGHVRRYKMPFPGQIKWGAAPITFPLPP